MRYSSLVNMDCMINIGWHMIHNRVDLWVKVIRSKYGCGADLLPKVDRKTDASNLWRDLCSSWDHVEGNISWKSGNDRLIQF